MALAALSTPGALDDAERVAARTLDAAERIAYPFGISCNVQTVTLCRLAAGDLPAAANGAERLLDVFARGGPGDVRRALDVAAAVLHAAGHPAADDVAATARGLPDTNPMIVHLRLPDGGAAPLPDRAAAVRLAHRAVDRLARLHPELGDHLRRSLRTGTYCSYQPDPPVRWEVRSAET